MSNGVGWSSSHSVGNRKVTNFFLHTPTSNLQNDDKVKLLFFPGSVLCDTMTRYWPSKEYLKAIQDTIITSFLNLTICVSGYYPGSCRLPQFTNTHVGAVYALGKQYQQYQSYPWQPPIWNPNPNVLTWCAGRRSESRGSFFMTRTIRPLTSTWSLD